ncbi:MAG: nucleotidyltransferase domain-containing protein [Polyangiaceae bacterium]|nr:nucleotidyltransferase domain-containing protein [Polyangiaceae bacterium]
MTEFPKPVRDIIDLLSGMPGAVAVALGGSRALGTNDANSDWDLAVYYERSIDTSALSTRGTVHPPGAWGPIMNGGAWLREEGVKIDVLLRDLVVVERWCEKAREGVYELDALLGYVAGAPTYSLMAELAVGRVLVGKLPSVDGYPEALASKGRDRWMFDTRFSLEHARMRARRGEVVGVVAQAARAAIAAAHSRLCDRRVWVLNEKGILERAGLADLNALFARPPTDAPALDAWVSAVEAVCVG